MTRSYISPAARRWSQLRGRQDQRRHVRHAVGADIQLTGNHLIASGKVTNLSLGGMAIETSLALPAGERLRFRSLRLLLDGECVVRHSHPDGGACSMGVAFELGPSPMEDLPFDRVGHLLEFSCLVPMR
jgi:hypothetical protein